MMPAAAVSLILIGGAAALVASESPRWAAKAGAVLAALVVLVVNVAMVAEYLLATDLRFHHVLFHVDAGPYAGRPAMLTSVALAMLSSGLLVFNTRPHAIVRPSECLVLLGGLAAYSALIAFAFGGGPISRLMRMPTLGVALPTAAALLLISLGMLLERPGGGLMSVAVSRGPGGVLLRRLAIPALTSPALLGIAVTRLASSLGAGEPTFQVALLAGSTSVLGLIPLTLVAAALNRAHRALEESHARTRELVDLAPDGIFLGDLDGRCTDVNGAGCRMLGYTREEIIGKPIIDVIEPAEIERLRETREALLEGGTEVGEWHLRRKDGTYLPVEISTTILPQGRWQGFVRDVSERTRAREELRQSRERFELALAGADLSAWDWNIASGEMAFNARWAEMRGFRFDELRGHIDTWVAGIHPEDWPHVKKTLEDYLRGANPVYEAEMRVRTKSGAWLWILDRGKVFARNERDEPTRMAGTELDITARKAAEAALRLAEAKASGILAMSADAIISLDTEQRITMFNDAAERMFGYSKAEAIGAPLEMLLPERRRAEHRRWIHLFAAGPSVTKPMMPEGPTATGLRRNGQEFPVDAAISKLTVEDTIVLTIALRDASDQKRREWEQQFLAEIGLVLAASLDYEETLARVAQLAVRELADFCIVDTVDSRGAIERLDVACRDQDASKLCEALKRGPPNGKPSELFDAPFRRWQAMLIEEVTPAILSAWAQDDEELRILRAAAPISVIAVPLVAREKLLGVLKLFSSTPSHKYEPADLRVAQEVARQAALCIDNARLYQTAMRAIREREDVLGVVAHDLRNPLGTISMNVEVLGRREAGSPPGHLSPLDRIRRAATRMDRQIRDLLDVARLDAGHLSIEPGRQSTARVLGEIQDAYVEDAALASCTLHGAVAPDVPDVWADRDRLLEIFDNLVGNALKFTGPGGRVTVGAAPRDGEVMFFVSDTGPGMSTEEVSHLFDRFWQASRSDRRGAGLGMSIVKGLVEAHRGHLWVESAPGRGTTVFFTVPAAPRPAEQHEHAPPTV
jgi:PAS domain S-box-containing protein